MMTSEETGPSVAARRAKVLKDLVEHRLLISTGVRGLYGHGQVFEQVLRGIQGALDQWTAADGAEPVEFPPVMSRASLAQTSYLENFPHLCGSIHAFMGGEGEAPALRSAVKAAEDWGPHLQQADVVMTPAACYPLYPTLAGPIPEAGLLFDLCAYCFRHEPSDDPARMQSFRIRENVKVGTPEQVQGWRELWLERAATFLQDLELPGELETANDPFFGRGGRMLKANQRSQKLKFELLVPIFSDVEQTACASFNYHQDYFGQTFGIRLPGGEPAHTACLGFGLERLAIALLAIHGLNPGDWPKKVQKRLLS